MYSPASNVCVHARACAIFLLHVSQELATLENDAIGTVAHTYDMAQQNEYVQMQWTEVTSAVMYDLIFVDVKKHLPLLSPQVVHRDFTGTQLTNKLFQIVQYLMNHLLISQSLNMK